MYILLISTVYLHAEDIPNYTMYPGFQKLSDVISYRDHVPESPPGNFQNPLDPDYSMFYMKTAPGMWRDIFSYLPLTTKPIWTSRDCAAVLHEVNQQQPKHPLNKPVAHLRADPDVTRLYIWGDVHAAFHSLSRDLEHLHEKGIINKELKIQSPHHYFVFNGDAVNYGPYSMETLTLIGNLMLKNKGQIIYIAGRQERNQYWKNSSLQRQINAYQEGLWSELPFEDIINTFFSHLPHAVYVTTTSSPEQALYISYYGILESEIDDAYLGGLFSHESTYHEYDAAEKAPTKHSVDTVSLIKSEPWMYSQRAENGLGMLEQERGATSWTVLSSPIYPHRKFYPFTYDAYAVVEIGQRIPESIIRVYHQPYDSKALQFTQAGAYNVYTGVPEEQAQAQHVTHTFDIGSTMGLILNLRVMSSQTRQGAMMKINMENQKGGIHDSTHIRMYTYNDDYQPYKAQQNIQHMIDQGITTILCPTGTPTLAGYLDKVRNNEILVLFPITGSPLFRKPDLTGLIHVRATYGDEVDALVDYMIDDYNADSFAFFYQDDEYGLSALRTARKKLKDRGITQWKEVPYVRGSASFKEQAEEIRQAAPQVIGFFSASEPLIKLIREIGIPWLSNKYMMAITFAFTQETRRFLNEVGLSMQVGAVTPNPHVSQLPIAKEYRAAMDARNEEYDKFSFEAYIATSILIDAAEKADHPVTRDKIRRMIETYDHYAFKGLTLTFDPEKRSIAPGVWIETAHDKSKPWQKMR